MPLERIANQVLIDQNVSRRRLVGGVLVTIGGLSLVSCSNGNVREAERGRTRDAERTSVVDDLQATKSASLVNGTPPSTPES